MPQASRGSSPYSQRSLGVAILALAILTTLGAPSIAEAQQADASFPQADGPVYATSVLGQTLYIGGFFNYVGPCTGGCISIDSHGDVAKRWPRVNGTVLAIQSDGAGGCFIGGEFGDVGGVPRANLAHVRSDGSLDGWAPSTNGTVRAMCQVGASLVIGGDFDLVSGSPRSHLAALDASTAVVRDGTPPADSTVCALLAVGNKLYVGGHFGRLGGSARDGAGAFDMGSGQVFAWDPSTNGAVNVLLRVGPNIALGGEFDAVGGAPRAHLAIADSSGGVVAAWHCDTDGPVYTLGLRGSTLYVGGRFTTLGGLARPNAGATSSASGIPTVWSPKPDAPVRTLLVTTTNVFLAGEFTALNGGQRSRLGAVDLIIGTSLAAWAPSTNGPVDVLASSGTSFFAGGGFTLAGGAARRSCAAIDLPTGSVTAFNPQVSSLVLTICPYVGAIYLGGFFTYLGSTQRNGMGAVSPSTGVCLAWDPDGGLHTYQPRYIESITADAGRLYVGGIFTDLGGVQVSNLVALDSQTGIALDWGPGGTDNEVSAVLATDSSVFVGGWFTQVGTSTKPNLARLDRATGKVLKPVAQPDWGVVSLAVVDSTLNFGGYYRMVDGTGLPCLAEVDSRTGQLKDWNPEVDAPFILSNVASIVATPQLLYIGGSFTTAGGQRRLSAAAIDPASGTATGWAPDPDGYIRAMAMWDERLLMGGRFGSICGQPLSNLASVATATTQPVALALLGPTAGQTILVGSTTPITWSAAGGLGVESVEIDLSASGPNGPWQVIAAALQNTGNYPWAVPGAAVSTNAYLRIVARYWGDAEATTTSAGPITISDLPTSTLLRVWRAAACNGAIRVEWETRDSWLQQNVRLWRQVGVGVQWEPVAASVTLVGGTNTCLDPLETESAVVRYCLRGTTANGGEFVSEVLEVNVGSSPAGVRMLSSNPVRGVLNFEVTTPSPADLESELFDVSGRSVKRMHQARLTAGSHSLSLGVRDLSCGVYFLRVRVGSLEARRRLCVVR